MAGTNGLKVGFKRVSPECSGLFLEMPSVAPSHELQGSDWFWIFWHLLLNPSPAEQEYIRKTLA